MDTEAALDRSLAPVLLDWYDRNKRSFSFRDTGDPYRIWISEIMLQQTRTETAEPYFDRFIDLFPDVASLANAELNDVLKAWEGLGYYSRARNLHKASQIIHDHYHDVFPRSYEDISSLPGIGKYTAAAICSIAYDEPIPAMDGNLTRVFSRLGFVTDSVDKKETVILLGEIAKSCMPEKRCGDFNQALMDLGATICVPGTPDCDKCPLSSHCRGRQAGQADLLPVKPADKSPVPVDVKVILMTCEDRIALVQRQSGLLKGLYTFLTYEDQQAPVWSLLKASGIDILTCTECGTARHVFTHRIWNMTIYHCAVKMQYHLAHTVWADRSELLAFPIPTAMSVPLSKAKILLDPASTHS